MKEKYRIKEHAGRFQIQQKVGWIWFDIGYDELSLDAAREKLNNWELNEAAQKLPPKYHSA